MSRPSKREHIVDVALELFYKNGFHATSVDTIINAANVSKKTLYHHFTSKDELVIAVLRKRDELFRNMLVRNVETRTKDPKQKLLAVFDALNDWFLQDNFYGCMFINASAECFDEDSPSRRICREHQQMITGYLTTWAQEAGYDTPEALAQNLSLIMSGAIVHAHTCGNKNAALEAKALARHVIVK